MTAKEAIQSGPHSLIPWRVDPLDKRVVLSEDGMVCDTSLADDSLRPIEIENAAFIVRAVNAHEELIAQLKSAVLWLENCPAQSFDVLSMKRAIAKAEGK